MRPIISVMAASRSASPWPVTAQVKITLMNESLCDLINSQKPGGAQSILLTTRTIGEEEPDAFCHYNQKPIQSLHS